MSSCLNERHRISVVGELIRLLPEGDYRQIGAELAPALRLSLLTILPRRWILVLILILGRQHFEIEDLFQFAIPRNAFLAR